MSASIAALVLCSIKNEPMAANTHISMSKYSIAVSTLSKNVKNAVGILNSKLIGNKIIFNIHLIIYSSSLSKTFFVSPHTISMQTFTSI